MERCGEGVFGGGWEGCADLCLEFSVEEVWRREEVWRGVEVWRRVEVCGVKGCVEGVMETVKGCGVWRCGRVWTVPVGVWGQ